VQMKVVLALLVVLVAAACGAPGGLPSGSPLSTAQLKFAVIDAVGPPVYCDPDYYPVARVGAEQENANANYAVIRADASVYAAIAAHEHLPSGELDDAQKLTLYRAYKLLRALTLTPGGEGYSFQVRVRPRSGANAYELVDGMVSVDGRVTVNARTPTGAPMCPICLAASTLIATPFGPVRVTDIQPGMVVWTTGADGLRVAASVLKAGSMAAPRGHLMVHLVLADGRQLLASPGHRVADGRALGALHSGDTVDGSTVRGWELVPYDGGRTYDLLPAGPTGTYWADGIMLESTLH